MTDRAVAMSSRQLLGVALGLVLGFAAAVEGVALWLSDPYVPPPRSKTEAVTASSGPGRPASAAQKIQHQRALQSELTRAIKAFSDVRSVRVHLVLPGGGVDRKAGRAMAAIALRMAPGRSLSPTQVLGIQRLVMASVPDIEPEDVIVFDENDTSATQGELSSSPLDLRTRMGSDPAPQRHEPRRSDGATPSLSPSTNAGSTTELWPCALAVFGVIGTFWSLRRGSGQADTAASTRPTST